MAENTITMQGCADALETLLNETRQSLDETGTYYNETKTALEAAQRRGDAVRIAKANAFYTEAEQIYTKTRLSLSETVKSRLEAIQRDMERAISAADLADPAQVDMATVELLKSGTMRISDLENLAGQAAAKGNGTMLRLILAEAERQNRALSLAGNSADAVTRSRFAALMQKYQNTGNEYRGAFDAVAYVLRKGVQHGYAGYFDAQSESTQSALAILRK